MKKFGLLLLIFLLGLYIGLWFYSKFTIEQRVAQFIDTRNNIRTSVSYQNIRANGFPFPNHVTLSQPTITFTQDTGEEKIQQKITQDYHRYNINLLDDSIEVVTPKIIYYTIHKKEKTDAFTLSFNKQAPHISFSLLNTDNPQQKWVLLRYLAPQYFHPNKLFLKHFSYTDSGYKMIANHSTKIVSTGQTTAVQYNSSNLASDGTIRSAFTLAFKNHDWDPFYQLYGPDPHMGKINIAIDMNQYMDAAKEGDERGTLHVNLTEFLIDFNHATIKAVGHAIIPVNTAPTGTLDLTLEKLPLFSQLIASFTPLDSEFFATQLPKIANELDSESATIHIERVSDTTPLMIGKLTSEQVKTLFIETIAKAFTRSLKPPTPTQQYSD